MLHERDDHDAENDDADGNTPPEDHHVKIVGLFRKFGHALGHIECPIGARRARHNEAEQAKERFTYH